MSNAAKILVSAASGSFMTRVLGTGLAFATHVLFARLVGASSYGNYFFALTVVHVLALIGKLGLDTTTLRYVPALLVQGEWSLIRGFFRRVNQVAWTTSILLASALAVAVALSSGPLNLDAELRYVLWVACLVLPATVIMQVRSAGIQAFKRVVLAQLPPEVIRPITMMCAIGIVLYVVDTTITGPMAMGIEFLSIMLAIQAANLFLRWIIPGEVFDGEPNYDTKRWLTTALHLSLVAGLYVLLGQMGILFVGLMRGTTEAGIFGIAYRVSTLIAFGLNAVNSIAAPTIAELHSQRQLNDLQRMLTLAALGLLAFSVPVFLGLVSFGKFILSLFGPEFTDGYTALVILALGQLIHALAGPTGFLMTMTGHQKKAGVILLIGLLLNVLLSLLLVPTLGMNGAAIATAISTLYWNVAMYLYVRRILDVDSTLLACLRGSH